MRTLGCRGRRFGVPLAIGVLALGVGCTSSKPARVVEAAPADSARTESRTTAEVPTSASASEVRAMDVREGAPETYLELEASAPLVWTSFRNADGQVVLELPNSKPGPDLADLAPSAGLVSSVRIERDSQGTRPLMRLILQTRQEVEHSVVAEGNSLRLKLMPVEAQVASGAGSTPAPAESLAYEPVEEEAPAPAAEPAARATEPVESAGLGTPDAPVTAPEPTGAPATHLDEIVVAPSSERATVRLAGDGEFPYTTFVLDAPKRFVLDLPGVTNRSKRSSIPVGGPVDRVRVAQFRGAPNPVARVVFDLNGEDAPRIQRLGNTLVVTFGEGASGEAPVRTASFAPPPAPEATASYAEPATGGGTTEEPAAEEPASQPARRPASSSAGSGTAGPSDLDLAGRPTAASSATGSAKPVATVRATPEPRRPGSVEEAGTSGQTSSVSDCIGGGSDEHHYVGDPIDLKVTNADVTDVLRTFAQISGLNIVVQPGIGGQVTAELENVPWDQALAQVLKINNLGCELEGNVMRIAPTAVLRKEASDRQELATARALAVPLRTVLKRLSYATAQNVASVLRSGSSGILSQRGSVLVDDRTNTLIIKELPSYLDTVIAVIENLDTPEPQVMIEARIIETTKNYMRSLGIDWGINAVADAAHGNTTGLVFPNNVRGSGDVNLLTGGNNGAIGLRLGNVLNTFTLDLSLQAAESDGLINILSAPKVATLNNQRATIQSGVQIPIQTIANNTVTVQFVNATLRLDVVPQITAEGTVLMQIDISKREPQTALLVPGSANAPISTKDASTRVIVRDGGTAVIGGIYKISNNDGNARVPGLANIPLLGYLFRNKSVSNTNEELLIFITPRIIKL